jgi:hypothetical protein
VINNVTAQLKKQNQKNLIYVDRKGVIKYTSNNAETAFLSVNYTVSFASEYRSVIRTGIGVEKAIDQDVYHITRLGIKVFPIHVRILK